jgi:hypothetical protein
MQISFVDVLKNELFVGDIGERKLVQVLGTVLIAMLPQINL